MREAVTERSSERWQPPSAWVPEKKPVAWLQQHLYPLVAMAMSCMSLVHACARASARKTFPLDFACILSSVFFSVFLTLVRVPALVRRCICMSSVRKREWRAGGGGGGVEGRGRRSTTHSAGLPPPWLTPQDSVSNYRNIHPSVRGRGSKH